MCAHLLPPLSEPTTMLSPFAVVHGAAIAPATDHTEDDDALMMASLAMPFPCITRVARLHNEGDQALRTSALYVRVLDVYVVCMLPLYTVHDAFVTLRVRP